MKRRWFEYLWPWSRFWRLRVEHEETRVMLLAAIKELDLWYFERKWMEVMVSSPRMNCVITGIGAQDAREASDG